MFASFSGARMMEMPKYLKVIFAVIIAYIVLAGLTYFVFTDFGKTFPKNQASEVHMACSGKSGFLLYENECATDSEHRSPQFTRWSLLELQFFNGSSRFQHHILYPVWYEPLDAIVAFSILVTSYGFYWARKKQSLSLVVLFSVLLFLLLSVFAGHLYSLTMVESYPDNVTEIEFDG